MIVKTYWFVVHDQKTGDFCRAWGKGINEELASELFMLTHAGTNVIHVGEGEEHPKTYKSLKTVEK